jgi:hypothetical protein
MVSHSTMLTRPIPSLWLRSKMALSIAIRVEAVPSGTNLDIRVLRQPGPVDRLGLHALGFAAPVTPRPGSSPFAHTDPLRLPPRPDFINAA